MTRLELRRLALRATRCPELMPVLQDTLLESPVYGRLFERAIQEARELANANPHAAAFVVVFNPSGRLHVRMPFGSETPFRVQMFHGGDFFWQNPDSGIRKLAAAEHVVVFVVQRSRDEERLP